MKKLTIFLIFTFLLTSIYAQNTEHYLKITINDRSELETLTRMVSIDNVTGNEVIAYANSYQLEKLRHSSFPFIELEHPSVQGRPITMATTVEQMANWDRYPTYDVYNQLMRKFVTDYPDFCKLDTIGTSIQGRNMLALNISANINTPEAKPEVLFSSTMHGDEVTGWILGMRLAYYLLSNYNTIPRITNMLDSISLFIAPNTNPDGTYYNNNNNSVSNARRSNANGYDLNRNFPDPRAGLYPGGTRQKETTIMMEYAETRHFILGINYHGGAEVANYPWDTWTSGVRKHADNNWYVQISRQYADLVQAVAPSNYFRDQNNGITFGGDWYVIDGGRQDYMNYWQSCREITLEVGTKMPQSENLPNFWNWNREAMLAYIENAKYGIRGLVTNTDGEPLSAKVTVVGHDQNNSHVFTNPQFGNYYRMIQPGAFTFLFESYGYEPQTFTGVTSQQNKATILDVIMSKSPTYAIRGIVANAKTGVLVEGVNIKVKDTPITPTTTDESGNFSLSITKGTYQFVFTKDGFLNKEQTIDINEDTDFLLIALEPFTGFSFEDGVIPEGFTFQGNQPWYVTDNTAYHGVKSIRSGNISHNQNSTMNYAFTAENAGKVSFACRVSSESGYDFLRFYINGTLKDSWSGEAAWAEYTYDVPAGSHTLRWTYSKDGNTSHGSDCAWVDFISLPSNNQNAVPVVSPQSITLEAHEVAGETTISLWNIGNASMNFSAVVDNAQGNNWLTLSNHSGTLTTNQKNNIILSYNFASFSNGVYTTSVLINVLDTIISVPVSISFFENDGAIPYITPRKIDLETEESTGDCVVTMQNIGNLPLSYHLDLEPEQANEWLSLSHNSGVLEAGEQVEMILSYDFPIIVKEIYTATLKIDVTDSIIDIPVRINYILGIDDQVQNAAPLRIAPNPATNNITITIQDFSGIAHIEIFTLTGQKLCTNQLLNGAKTFAISDLGIKSAGIYFVKVQTNRFVEVVKLVVE